MCQQMNLKAKTYNQLIACWRCGGVGRAIAFWDVGEDRFLGIWRGDRCLGIWGGRSLFGDVGGRSFFGMWEGDRFPVLIC
jgi:hypothetical protein